MQRKSKISKRTQICLTAKELWNKWMHLHSLYTYQDQPTLIVVGSGIIKKCLSDLSDLVKQQVVFNVYFFFSTSHSKISIIFIYEIIIVSRKSEVTCRESQKYLKERKYALRLKNYETNGCIYTPSWA